MTRESFKFTVGYSITILALMVLVLVTVGIKGLLFIGTVMGGFLIIGFAFYYGSKLLDIIYDRWIR